MAYGQVWIDGVTSMYGQTPGLEAELGTRPLGTAPADAGWVWVPAVFNVDTENNDEFQAQLSCADLPPGTGTYQYLYRYRWTEERPTPTAVLRDQCRPTSSRTKPAL